MGRLPSLYVFTLTFDAFNAQLKEEFPVNDMGDLSWYLGGAFECDKMEGVVKMTQTAIDCRFAG